MGFGVDQGVARALRVLTYPPIPHLLFEILLEKERRERERERERYC